MFFLTACLGTSLWLWDYVTDPAGAGKTVVPRLFFLSLVVFVPAFKIARNHRILALTSMAATLLLEVLFVEILNRLHTGMTYGIGGFMFFMFAPLLLFAGFSWRLNLCYTLLAAGIPHLLALVDFAQGFQHQHYAVLIWPTAILMTLVHLATATSYLHRYELETALELASNTDPMTGVSNRRHFMPLLRQEIARGQRFEHHASLLMLDIDHFKSVNDTYGHPTGDMVICALADICRGASRAIDVVTRLGGEEFAIMLPDTDTQGALAVAERVRATVERTLMTSLVGVTFRFTVSIGIAEQVPEDTSEDNLIEMADAALYQAKLSGRNRVACLPRRVA
jgi:diguanylate cyclase (GGDEF)-like protein